MGCAFFFAMANVFFRDMAHILQVILSAWYFLCPIIYSLDFVPARYRVLFRLNPLVYPLNGFRLAIYYGLLPSAQSMAMSLGRVCHSRRRLFAVPQISRHAGVLCFARGTACLLTMWFSGSE